MKDHEIREAINELRDIAIKYHAAQQLREQIARVVLKLCDKDREDKIQPGYYDRNEIMTEDNQVDFNKATHRIVCVKTEFGDSFAIETKDTDTTWLRWPGLFTSSVEADGYYKEWNGHEPDRIQETI